MRRSRTKATFAVLAAAALAAACSDTRDLLAPAGGPATSASAAVQNDSDWVFSPGGWVRRGCVHEVPNYSVVEQSGRVHRPDGSTYDIPACRWAGRKHGAPADTGWVESARYYPGVYYHQINANWTVPAAPAQSYTSPQVYYTFPGLQNGSYIVQPVLSYGYAPDYGGNKWMIASWRCGGVSNSDCRHGPALQVYPGDQLYGSVTASNCANGSCTWTIVTLDQTRGTSSTWSPVDSDNYYDAVGGAVETHGNIASCSYFPAAGVFYTNVTLLLTNGASAGQVWQPVIAPNLSPNCGFAVTSPNGATVNMIHNPPPPPPPTVTSLTTAPSPPVQYTPFNITITGSGFDPNTVEAWYYGPGQSSYTYQYTLSSKTSTQLTVSNFVYGTTGTYTVAVRNGPNGTWSAPLTFTVVSRY
jgi:hypothetical protein